MNIVNLQRDLWHVPDIASPYLVFPTPQAQAETLTMVSDGIVKTDVGQAKSGWVETNPAAGQWSTIGLLMKQPFLDAACYRVKARCNKDGYSYVIIGYAPATPTGSDSILKVNSYPFRYEFDECFLLPHEDPGDTYDGQPLAFGIAIGQNAAGETESYISVQNLATAPPTYSSSVS